MRLMPHAGYVRGAPSWRACQVSFREGDLT